MKKKILGICGSASSNSGNLAILRFIAEIKYVAWKVDMIEDLSDFPHFRTEWTDRDVPQKILELRRKIVDADGVIICTPEYVFSIPSGLKNLIEWCVSTTVFSDKPTGLITASASGVKGHEELQLIMKTVQCQLSRDTSILIQGIKGKVADGKIIDARTIVQLNQFIDAFAAMI
ncbi:MAG: NAD(P)H-dependent oxidoreductase [Saprospiraceae bacterium]|nr:NAD(P)H-dependent oxidoreductase [Saprospiraceae bacterium]